jgi:cysteine-rich repeat protein
LFNRTDNSLRSHCGNFVKEIGEDCDDGNLINGDGCSNTCLNEGSVPGQSTCGDGAIGLGEECEPSSSSYCDTSTCLWTGNSNVNLDICGNGIVESTEECDPFGSGCSPVVYDCSVSGRSLCGDGIIVWARNAMKVN